MTDEPVLEFIPEALARPAAEVVDAMIVAAWELRHLPHHAGIRGVLHAGQWLAQVRQYAPVSGEDRMPVQAAIRDELDSAQAVQFGLPTADRYVDTLYAEGVARMLQYALDPDAAAPLRLVHTPPSSAA